MSDHLKYEIAKLRVLWRQGQTVHRAEAIDKLIKKERGRQKQTEGKTANRVKVFSIRGQHLSYQL